MGRTTRRGPWLPEEDATLLRLVHIQGPHNWVRISQHIQHRSPKQCRERYHQNLKSSLNHAPISNPEGELIERLVQEMGKRWAEIARRLGNRSDNAVKNWWNGSMNRRRRNTTHAAAGTVGPRHLPVPATASPRAEARHSLNAVYNSNLRSIPSPDHMSRGLALDFRPTAQMNGAAAHQAFRHDVEQQPLPQSSAISSSMTAHMEARNSGSSDSFLPASSSRQLTPNVMLPGYLQPPPSLGLRPSPFERRPSLRTDWQIPRLPESSAISPAATEYSIGPSFYQAPSLISDNQSHYSISPRTISSPRPGMPAIDPPNQTWYSEHRRNSYAAYSQSGKDAHDEEYVSALPQSALSEPATATFPYNPSLRRHVAQSMPDPRTDVDHRSPSTPTGKDSRMTVSSLLG